MLYYQDVKRICVFHSQYIYPSVLCTTLLELLYLEIDNRERSLQTYTHPVILDIEIKLLSRQSSFS